MPGEDNKTIGRTNFHRTWKRENQKPVSLASDKPREGMTRFGMLRIRILRHLPYLIVYGVASLVILLPIMTTPGVPGHVVDWALPASVTGAKEFATQTG